VLHIAAVTLPAPCLDFHPAAAQARNQDSVQVQGLAQSRDLAPVRARAPA